MQWAPDKNSVHVRAWYVSVSQGGKSQALARFMRKALGVLRGTIVWKSENPLQAAAASATNLSYYMKLVLKPTQDARQIATMIMHIYVHDHPYIYGYIPRYGSICFHRGLGLRFGRMKWKVAQYHRPRGGVRWTRKEQRLCEAQQVWSTRQYHYPSRKSIRIFHKNKSNILYSSCCSRIDRGFALRQPQCSVKLLVFHLVRPMAVVVEKMRSTAVPCIKYVEKTTGDNWNWKALTQRCVPKLIIVEYITESNWPENLRWKWKQNQSFVQTFMSTEQHITTKTFT